MTTHTITMGKKEKLAEHDMLRGYQKVDIIMCSGGVMYGNIRGCGVSKRVTLEEVDMGGIVSSDM